MQLRGRFFSQNPIAYLYGSCFGYVGSVSRSAHSFLLPRLAETSSERGWLQSMVRRCRSRPGLCLWTSISLIGGSGEIWIALYALNLHATFVNALILQSMVLTIRSAAFAVPGGLGVQEGGYLFVGNLLGIPGDAAFALSLIARVRELALGIPGLICWQLIEARRLWRRRLAANAR